jgi:hypothetical protein
VLLKRVCVFAHSNGHIVISGTKYVSFWLLQADEAWHAPYHQLRHFKQVHHHLRVPASPSTATAAAAAAATAGMDTAAEDGSSSSDQQWEGLADWLQQQRQRMAASDKLAVLQQRQQDSGGPAAIARLSSLQMRMLKALGV